jgi:hypothetical protein
MDSLIQALLALALLVIPAVGYLISQFIKLQQVKIANQIKAEEQRALSLTLQETASVAVKSTAQTVVAGHRGEGGALSPEVQGTAKNEALKTLKKLLSPEQLAAVRAQYGKDDGAVNEALDPILEAALHDMKTPKKES